MIWQVILRGRVNGADPVEMFFPRFIKWLSGLPASYALGLLWWGEITILLTSLTGGYLLSLYLFENMPVTRENWLFPLALVTYLVVFYLMHLAFSQNTALMEGLIHIHRLGGIRRIRKLQKEEARLKALKGEEGVTGQYDPFALPERIRASADTFKTRYFLMLPTSLILYLLSFTSTIYRIFARQILTWEPGYLVVPALVTAVVGCLCYWLMMPILPGYVSVRNLLGQKTQEGE